ncbi:MAG: ATP synthase F0 subunit B, partial [Acidobacteria bacterium]|nr:ATP synthase F0 subunit B [Acidobacteriota bacterium]
FFFIFLRWAFWRPLERVLAERRAATEGAHREADQLLGQADEKLRHYEEALRRARAEIYRQQEAARQQALDERARILRDTREKANQMVRQAKLDIANDVALAKKELEAESRRLAEEITRTLLEPARRGGRA